MTIEFNRQLAYRLCEKWSVEVGGDIEPYFALFHDDAIFVAEVNAELSPKLSQPWSKQNWRDYLSAQLKVFSIKWIVRGVTADIDRVAIEAMSDVTLGTHRYQNPYHLLVEVREQKIAKLKFYMDTLYAQQAFAWIEEEFAKANAAPPPDTIRDAR